MNLSGLLRHAVERGASDLHLGVGHPAVLRVNGQLERCGDPLSADAMLEMTRLVLGEEQFNRLRALGEVDAAYCDGQNTRYRVNAYREQGQYTLAIRVVARQVPEFATLGLPNSLLHLLRRPHGLILVTGPTGSGKTTTLASMIQHINETQSKHILTLEDPIEYLYTHGQSIIHQREIGNDTDAFAPALRAALRQDPDVILVGELRDLDTVRTAVTASETGHLVLSTLHTGDAVQTVDRLIDMFPEGQQTQIRSQLASILLAVVSQRLVQTRDGGGRVCLAELLVNTPAVSNLIRTDKTHQLRSVMQTSKQQGMQTFAMAARERLQQGDISHEVADDWLNSAS